MDKEDITFFNSYEDLQKKLNKTFSTVDPDALNELGEFLKNFKKHYPMPEDVLIYLTEIPIVALEVTSPRLLSTGIIGSIEKDKQIRTSKRILPPVVVVKGAGRNIMVYGEPIAVEAYIGKIPLKTIVLDVDKQYPFTVLNLGDWESAFLVPLIERELEKMR